MTDPSCPIWYTNYIFQSNELKWGFMVCEECLINWIKTEAKYEFITAGKLTRSANDAIEKQKRKNYSTIVETIKCLNIECQRCEDDQLDNQDHDAKISHRLTYEECFEFIQKSPEQKYRDEYSSVMLDILVPNSNTNVRCPRQGWDYIGYINPRNKWSNFLNWEKWGYKWMDNSLTPFCKKLKKSCWSWNMNFNIFNQLQKVIRAQACPGWGISIIKGPGCKHMMCQKCNKEFWWHCLGDYPSYIHKGVIFCPFRIILKVFIWIYLITCTINLKIAIEVDGYMRIMQIVAYSVGIWALANVMMFSVLITFVFKQIYSESSYQTGFCNALLSMTCLFLTFLWPAGWITGWVCAYIFWELGKTMLWILLWQFVALIGIAIIIFIIVLIVKCYENRARERNYRRYAQQIPENEDIFYQGNLGDSLLLSDVLSKFEKEDKYEDMNMGYIAEMLHVPDYYEDESGVDKVRKSG